MGMKYSATPNEASSENTTVSAISPKICPATPSTKTMGKNTVIVVSVEANTAVPTSRVPRMVAWIRSSPSSRQRKMLSSTTIELSTSIPTPRASPPSDMILSDTSNMYIGAKVAMIDTGIVRPTISVWTTLRKNTKSTSTAIVPPMIALIWTSLIEFLIKPDWSDNSSSLAPGGRRWPMKSVIRKCSIALRASSCFFACSSFCCSSSFFFPAAFSASCFFSVSSPSCFFCSSLRCAISWASRAFCSTYSRCCGKPKSVLRTLSATATILASPSL